jgi:AcrR family transcriptional regulator
MAAEEIQRSFRVETRLAPGGRRFAARTRPRGRSALQEEQSLASRQKILDAAEKAFLENSYASTTVDDILRRADIGRATFYRHFSSVFEVAKGLIDQFKPGFLELYEELGLMGSPSTSQVEDWIRHHLRMYRETSPFMVLLLEVSGAEPEFFPILTALAKEYMSRLSIGIPAFRQAASGRPECARAATAALLLLQNLSSFCYLVVLRGWDISEELAIGIIARDFVRFIEEYGEVEVEAAQAV